MDFGFGVRPTPTWGGDVDDGHMRGAAMPPAIDFPAVAAGVPKDQGGGILNPGPSPADAQTPMFGRPHGELFLGPQDSHISSPSFTPIVHSLFVEDVGNLDIDHERFFTKGHLAAIVRIPPGTEHQETKTRKMRRSLNRRWQSQIQPTRAILGPVYDTVDLSGYECTGLYPLSEGTIFQPHRKTEQTAITVHDHAEVVTANPKEVMLILTKQNPDLWDYLHRNTELYHPDNVMNTAIMGSSLWVIPVPVPGASNHKLEMIPVINPTEIDVLALSALARTVAGPPGLVGAVGGIYHVGTLKQGFTYEDDTWTLTFSPHM